jgi:hypothetical protein
MKHYKKPHFIIKKNPQQPNKGNYFDVILTSEILADVCHRITGRSDYTYNFVENEYTDEYLPNKTYNEGRLAVLLYHNSVSYITFSGTSSGGTVAGRNSYVQSTATAFNYFFACPVENKKIFYYFLPVKKGNAETNYLMFYYRLLKTIGVEFINQSDALNNEIIPFYSAEDIIAVRNSISQDNKSNNPTFITKDANTTSIYGKTFGASKYETSLFCYALSYLPSTKSIKLYEIAENGLTTLPKSCLSVVDKLGKIERITTGRKMEKTELDKDDNIRLPKFMYNLFLKLGQKECAFCSCKVQEIIEAAHIWSISDIKKSCTDLNEKIDKATDGDNGLWLCRNHHKMFDENLVSIDNAGIITYADNLNDDYNAFIEETTTKESIMPLIFTKGFAEYLELRYKNMI